MIEENKRVLLGMSGGTDSSVAAMRLLEAGYEVIGVTFRFYELNGSTEYLEDARNLAERLGIRHITYDAREIFAQQIIEYFGWCKLEKAHCICGKRGDNNSKNHGNHRNNQAVF